MLHASSSQQCHALAAGWGRNSASGVSVVREEVAELVARGLGHPLPHFTLPNNPGRISLPTGPLYDWLLLSDCPLLDDG